ncbi:MAG TPA: hypothetical protein VKK79_17375, partial [Candidatus Lokiarchaeia archaeon]|nr:hypothetical protein [Candidatus Lokiarchaeia archaeon]
VNIRVEYAQILGIPRPYFWITVIGAIAVFGPLLAYRTVKNARIPPFIKKITRVRNLLKKQKIRGVTMRMPTRNEALREMRAGDLAAIGIAPLTPNSPKDKISEKGQAEKLSRTEEVN